MNEPGTAKGFPGIVATTDEYLRAVTVGERVPLNATITLAPYDPTWPSRFALLAGRIRGALADKAQLLEHVGSTSVPGLVAKPVIDMMLAVSNSTEESDYVPPLENVGFSLRIREPACFEHRLLAAADIESHLHVFSVGCEEIPRPRIRVGAQLRRRDRPPCERY